MTPTRLGGNVSDIRTRRFTLTPDELAVLAEVAQGGLPPGFVVPSAPEDPRERSAIVEGLRRAGVWTRDDPGRPVLAVLADFVVLSSPDLTLQVEAVGPGGRLFAAYALRGEVGVSVFAGPDGGIELSAFPGVLLGEELRRAVPSDPWGAAERPSVDPRADDVGGLSGRLPWELLAEPLSGFGIEADDVAGAFDPEELALSRRIQDACVGALVVTIGGPSGRGRGEALIGRVVWLMTANGYLGAETDPDPDGRRMVLLREVSREEIGVWVAPAVAAVLEAEE